MSRPQDPDNSPQDAAPDLDALLGRAYDGAEPAVPIALLLEVSDAVVRQAKPGAGRRRAARVAASIAIAAVLVPGGMAAATTGWQAFTGERFIFDLSAIPEHLKQADNVIDACAPDLAQFATTLPEPMTPAPPDTTWTQLAVSSALRSQAASRRDCESVGVIMSERSVRGDTMTEGLYVWQCVAVERAASGDAEGAAIAAGHVADLAEELGRLGTWHESVWRRVSDAGRRVDIGALADFGASSPVVCA